MSKIGPVTCALLVALFTGCRLLSLSPSPERPAWAAAPAGAEDSIKFISVVGTATVGTDREAAMEEADGQARQKLADAVVEYTRTVAREFLEAHHPGSTDRPRAAADFMDTLAAEVSADILRRCMRQDSWDGPNGRSYVFYRLSVAVVNESIPERMRSTLGHINLLGAGAEQAPADMQQFLAQRLHERLRDTVSARPVTPETPPERRPPTWLEAGRHEDYPAERYLVTIGVGTDPASAKTSARAELVTQVEHGLADIMRALSRPDADAVLAQNVRASGNVAPPFTEDQLPATMPAQTWHDVVTDTHYALAVLDRAAASVLYPQKIGQALKQYEGLSTSGRNHEEADNYAASLRDFLDALRAAREALDLQLRALVLAPEADAGKLRDVIGAPVLEQAGSNVRSLLAKMRLQKIGGDDQWTAPGMPPKKPFRVRLTAGDRDKSVAGLPVRLCAERGGEPTYGRCVTDESGVAQWRVGVPLPAGTASCTLVAELDLAQFAPHLAPLRFEPPSVGFSCVMRSRGNTLFAPYVLEVTPTGRFLASSLAGSLEQALSTEKYSVLPETDVVEHVKADDLDTDSTEAEVLAAFADLRASIGGDRFLAIVFGTVRTELVQTVPTGEGELYLVHCPYSIEVLDPDLPEGQRTMLKVTGTGTGAYAGDHREAARRAKADAASALAAQVLAEIRGKFGPPEG